MNGDPAGDPSDPKTSTPPDPSGADAAPLGDALPLGPLPSPFVVDIQMRFRDTDRLGHVNNATVATYAEVGRLEYFRAAGANLTSMILARLALDFRRQIYLGESVQVETRTVDIGTSSITVQQRVLAAGNVATEIESVIVCFDYDAQRPVPVPDRLRRVLMPDGG